MEKSKITKWIAWSSTRVGLLLLGAALLAPHVINMKAMGDRLKVRRLNDNRPDFRGLIGYVQDAKVMREAQWNSYYNYFNMVLTYLPNDPVTESILGFIDLERGRHKHGVELLEKSAQQLPLWWPDYNLGLYYYRQGEFKLAAQHFEKLINVPKAIPLKIMLDSILYRQIFSTSNFSFSLNQRIASAYEDALIMLLASLDHLGAYDVVLGLALKGATQSFSKQAPLYYYAGLSCLKLKQFEKAVALFEKAVSLDPKAPWNYFWLGKLCEIAGDEDNAQRYFKIAVVLQNSQPERAAYDQLMRYRIF